MTWFNNYNKDTSVIGNTVAAAVLIPLVIFVLPFLRK